MRLPTLVVLLGLGLMAAGCSNQMPVYSSGRMARTYVSPAPGLTSMSTGSGAVRDWCGPVAKYTDTRCNPYLSQTGGGGGTN
jgi:hypothetical protein